MRTRAAALHEPRTPLAREEVELAPPAFDFEALEQYRIG